MIRVFRIILWVTATLVQALMWLSLGLRDDLGTGTVAEITGLSVITFALTFGIDRILVLFSGQAGEQPQAGKKEQADEQENPTI